MFFMISSLIVCSCLVNGTCPDSRSHLVANDPRAVVRDKGVQLVSLRDVSHIRRGKQNRSSLTSLSPGATLAPEQVQPSGFTERFAVSPCTWLRHRSDEK